MPTREFTYSDLDYALTISSDGNPKIVRDTACINQSIKTILSTTPGERIMQPQFGSRIHQMVFEQMDAITIDRIRMEVQGAIQRWENRIRILATVVRGDEDRQTYTITVNYVIVETGENSFFEGKININDQ